MINGDGVYTWENDDIYNGPFLDGEMHGHGIYSYSSGKVYEGEFENGFKNGYLGRDNE